MYAKLDYTPKQSNAVKASLKVAAALAGAGLLYGFVYTMLVAAPLPSLFAFAGLGWVAAVLARR